MTKLQEISHRGNLAVRYLRQQKFKAGQPFMIYSKELSSQFVYLEFSTGVIQLAEVKSGARDFIIVRDLSDKEAAAIRKKFKLS